MKGIVIDPGGDVKQLLMLVEQLGVSVEKLVLTHGHLDHVGGTVEMAESLKVDIVGPHKADNFWLQG
ncbi:hypothetical metal-binding enzyme YcbL homolog [Vibrio maritimus]|uniref:Hypothetical metal-binding enzyme YcbL homolog n=3 Tax=Vibrio TaxID=662 RepID=A0A090S708_9VIBR|nr:hypothetical metal-binding enzyme YcbL homolog [Vibrio maritimus]GAL30125.1 hypothetical metal-binding enzyme YcbL homolog [Vibrio variabilis]